MRSIILYILGVPVTVIIVIALLPIIFERSQEGSQIMALTLTSRQSGEVTVIGLSGRLDHESGPVVLQEILRDVTVAGARKILLNMCEVSFVDSSGLGDLASGHVRAKHQGAALN
jgi:anti-anti-sigma factor